MKPIRITVFTALLLAPFAFLHAAGNQPSKPAAKSNIVFIKNKPLCNLWLTLLLFTASLP